MGGTLFPGCVPRTLTRLLSSQKKGVVDLGPMHRCKSSETLWMKVNLWIWVSKVSHSHGVSIIGTVFPYENDLIGQ